MARRLIQTSRGRLLLLLLAVLAVILGTAAIDHFVLDRYDGYGDAVWSALLHLLDPAQLEDDHGAGERAIGMFQVLTGIVLLVGVLLTLVTESVGATIERLGTLQAPTRRRDHLLVVGSADQLRQAARALAYAAEMGSRELPVVALAPRAAQRERDSLLQELRERAAPLPVELLFGEAGAESGFALGAAERAHTVVLFPADWDAIVGDRVTSALLLAAIAADELPPEVDSLLDPHRRGDRGLLVAARAAARRQGRPPRLAVVGASNAVSALVADFVAAGPRAPRPTLLAPRETLEPDLGRAGDGGDGLELRETATDDPDQLAAALAESRPDIVLVTPGPTDRGLHARDAEATLTLLHVLRAVGPRVPVIAELALPESVDRLPADPRLLPLSSMEAVAGALALSVLEPERSTRLEEWLQAA